MSALISLRRQRRLVWIDTLRRVHNNIGYLVGRLICQNDTAIVAIEYLILDASKSGLSGVRLFNLHVLYERNVLP